MNENKTDWTEKRFQIVLKLIGKKEGSCYLDPQRIEQEADELMNYLQQTQENQTLKAVYQAIRKHIEEKWKSILNNTGSSQRLYATGIGDAFTYIKMLLDKIERETTK